MSAVQNRSWAPCRRQLLAKVCTENERRKQDKKRSEYFHKLVMKQKDERQR